MSYGVELARELKNRTNIKRIGNTLGTVLSVVPLKIGILGNDVILDSSNCFICSSLVTNYKRNVTMEIKAYTIGATANDTNGDSISSLSVPTKTDYDAVITYKDILKVKDKVLVISDADGQVFFLVDKVVL